MNSKITKNFLIKSLQDKQGMANSDAKKLVTIFFQILTSNLQSNAEIKINTFGTFRIVKRKSRKIISINGDEIQIPEQKKVKFIASKSLEPIH